MADDRNQNHLENLKRFRALLETIPSKQVPQKYNVPTSRSDLAIEESKVIADGGYDETERKRRDAETQTIRESNRDLRVNRKLRWKYAKWVFCYLVSYSVAVLFLLILAGFKICGFELSGQVLEFLVGSTAVSAIGLVLAVTTGLFRNYGGK